MWLYAYFGVSVLGIIGINVCVGYSKESGDKVDGDLIFALVLLMLIWPVPLAIAVAASPYYAGKYLRRREVKKEKLLEKKREEDEAFDRLLEKELAEAKRLAQ